MILQAVAISDYEWKLLLLKIEARKPTNTK